MAKKREAKDLGVRLKPTSQPTSENGDLSVSSSDNKLKVTTYTYLDYTAQVYAIDDKVKHTDGLNYICIQVTTGAEAPDNAAFWEVYEQSVVTEDQVQSLENKTIDATAASGNNTISTDAVDAVYDDTINGVSSLGTNVQDALDAVKTAIDNQNEASEISYDNSTSGLVASDVQAAIDEVEARVDTAESDITNVAGDLVTHEGLTAAHGTTGDVVGTSDTQTLSSKTLNGTNIIDGILEHEIQSINTSATEVDLSATKDVIRVTGDATGIRGVLPSDGGRVIIINKTSGAYQIRNEDAGAVATLRILTGTGSDLKVPVDGAVILQYNNDDSRWHLIGGSGAGGGATQFDIEQAAHGLSVGEGIYHNGTSWVQGQADDADTLAYYVVIQVADVNNFTAADFGRIEATAHGFTIGEYYFLSDSVAGQATNVEPSSGFSNPLFYVEDANTLQVKCLRPGAISDITLDSLEDVSVPSPTDGQALIYDNGNSRWEAKDIATSAADISYDNSTSGLTATDAQAAVDEVEGRVDVLEAATVALDDLSDVDAASPNDAEVLTYNSGSGNWEATKAPSSVINYIENGDLEIDATGWAQYNDGAADIPVDGTGGSAANLSFARTSSSPLRGAGSALMSYATASSAQGEGVSYDFTIDNADQAQKLTLSFDYEGNVSNYNDGDLKVFVYDVTNSVLIRVNGEDVMAKDGSHIAQFQTAADSTSYRLIVHIATAVVGLTQFKFDNVQVGPSEKSVGGLNEVVVEGAGNGGTSIAANATNIDFTETRDTSGSWNGSVFTVPESGNYSISGSIRINSAANVTSNFYVDGIVNVTIGSDTTQSSHPFCGSIYLDKGQELSIRISANTTLQNSTINHHIHIQKIGTSSEAATVGGGRDVVVRGAGNSGAAITPNTERIDFTVVKDTTASWSQVSGNGDDTFTAPESGEYDINGSIRITSNTALRISAYIDNVAEIALNSNVLSATRHSLNGSVYLEKGQTLDFRSSGTITLSSHTEDHWIVIVKRNSGQTALETETVAARYTSNNGQAIGTGATDLKYEDVDYDTHNSYNVSTGEYTVPVSGIYDIHARYLNTTSNAKSIIDIEVNGTRVAEDRTRNISAGTNMMARITEKLSLTKGDVVIIRGRTDSSSSMSTDGPSNTFSIARIK